DVVQVGYSQRLSSKGDVAETCRPRRRVNDLLGTLVGAGIIGKLYRAANDHCIARFAKLGLGTVFEGGQQHLDQRVYGIEAVKDACAIVSRAAQDGLD